MTFTNWYLSNKQGETLLWIIMQWLPLKRHCDVILHHNKVIIAVHDPQTLKGC